MKKLLVTVLCFSLISIHQCIVDYSLQGTENGILLTLLQDDRVKLSGRIGYGLDFSDKSCVEQRNCSGKEFSISIHSDHWSITWESNNISQIFEDCFNLDADNVNWFGGPEKHSQQWPIEKIKLDGSVPYVLLQNDNSAVVERYWLNSKGAYVFVDDRVPLYVDQRTNREGQVCFIAKVEGPYFNRTRNFLHYNVGLKENAKVAHLDAINSFLGKPLGYPNPKIIKEPIWTTWAKYKADISDDIVLSFADDIRDHGFENGQLEIDDNWEVCYGAQEFNQDTFANISYTVKLLKDKNYRVSLWIHPFVDHDCQNNADVGNDQGYFVKNTTGSTQAQWWNGNNAHQIDFTKSEATQWFVDRLKKLQDNPGIHSFKFDAGETTYGPQPSVYEDVDQELIPNILSKQYLTACSTFGDLIEVRSAWRTQELPVLVRMIDKDSVWGDTNNGLHSLITTLLQMNINGYPLVLPDMIGGNGYGNLPTAELLVRWTQANTFMPAMQFSYLPWDITSDEFDSVAIVKKFVAMHRDYADEIIKAMNESTISGTPVNPPIWWVDPTDPAALSNDDEYLLGENILVAPIIQEGATSRDVYLPKGTWRDANNGTEYAGPALIEKYPAPIDVLPYFIKL